MKNVRLYLLLFIPIVCMLYSTIDKRPFSFPIRIIENNQESIELEKDDIKLLINGTSREVANLIKQERSLSRVPDLGRHIILSFHNIKASRSIRNAISYFFTEILGQRDTLILLSPIKAYRIPVIRDKEKMIVDVVNILDKDCTEHEKDRISAEKT